MSSCFCSPRGGGGRRIRAKVFPFSFLLFSGKTCINPVVINQKARRRLSSVRVFKLFCKKNLRSSQGKTQILPFFKVTARSLPPSTRASLLVSHHPMCFRNQILLYYTPKRRAGRSAIVWTLCRVPQMICIDREMVAANADRGRESRENIHDRNVNIVQRCCTCAQKPTRCMSLIGIAAASGTYFYTHLRATTPDHTRLTKKRASLIRVMKRCPDGTFQALIKVFVEIKKGQKKFLRTTKGHRFFIKKGLKCTVGTPFHNANRGQKRYLPKSQKKRAKIFVLTPFLGFKNGQKKGGEIEDTKTAQKSSTDTVVVRALYSYNTGMDESRYKCSQPRTLNNWKIGKRRFLPLAFPLLADSFQLVWSTFQMCNGISKCRIVRRRGWKGSLPSHSLKKTWHSTHVIAIPAQFYTEGGERQLNTKSCEKKNSGKFRRGLCLLF